ncbi:MAG: aspartate kinase [Bacteroidota bacterium]
MTSSASADLYLAGVGAVGTALLGRLEALSDGAPRLVGACTTRGAVWNPDGLAPAALAATPSWDEPTDWNTILPRLEEAAGGARPVVFVDATSDPDVGRAYLRLLEAGVLVVTPSKHANTFEQAYFDALLAASGGGVRYRYETTVGAGLPVVQPVRDLRASGDRIEEIVCSPSGTLTFVFDRLGQGASFSEAVVEARQRGYAEPDVRDDLSGEDVVRKLIILARTAGYRVERSEVEVEPLTPPALADVPAAEVPDRLAAYDAAWSDRAAAAAAEGQVLRYVGRFEDGRIAVGVREVPTDSALGQLAGTDTLFTFRTERYGDAPITISGPGAGADVTAGGILADVHTVVAQAHAAQEQVVPAG